MQRLVLSLVSFCLAAPAALAQSAWIHITTPENVVDDATYLDQALLEGDTGHLLFVTANASAGPEWPHAVGVRHGENGWTIFNEDGHPMPTGLAFNMLRMPPADVAIAFQIDPLGNPVTFSHAPPGVRDPRAVVLATNYCCSTVGATIDEQIAVQWEGAQWGIVNQRTDDEPKLRLPQGSRYNVAFVPPWPTSPAFVYKADTYGTVPLLRPELLGDSGAILIVTPAAYSNGGPGIGWSRAVNVAYDDFAKVWFIFQPAYDIQPGSEFHVYVGH